MLTHLKLSSVALFLGVGLTACFVSSAPEPLPDTPPDERPVTEDGRVSLGSAVQQGLVTRDGDDLVFVDCFDRDRWRLGGEAVSTLDEAVSDDLPRFVLLEGQRLQRNEADTREGFDGSWRVSLVREVREVVDGDCEVDDLATVPTFRAATPQWVSGKITSTGQLHTELELVLSGLPEGSAGGGRTGQEAVGVWFMGLVHGYCERGETPLIPNHKVRANLYDTEGTFVGMLRASCAFTDFLSGRMGVAGETTEVTLDGEAPVTFGYTPLEVVTVSDAMQLERFAHRLEYKCATRELCPAGVTAPGGPAK